VKDKFCDRDEARAKLKDVLEREKAVGACSTATATAAAAAGGAKAPAVGGAAAVHADVAAWLEENGLDIETLLGESADDLVELFSDLGVTGKLKLQLKKATKDVR